MKKIYQIMQRLLKGQKGFTLIELLVAVGIVAILAGVAVPVVIKFVGSSEEKAWKAEFANVQTAVDALMADEYASTLSALPGCVPVNTPGTDDMSAFPCGMGSPHALAPVGMLPYIRVENDQTSCMYSVDDNGTVKQESCPR